METSEGVQGHLQRGFLEKECSLIGFPGMIIEHVGYASVENVLCFQPAPQSV
jgi:hypothetical protein